MATVLSGKVVADKLTEELKNRVQALSLRYRFAVLAVVRVAERSDDVSYERGILSRCEAVGIKVRRYILPKTVTQAELAGLLDELAHNPLFSGILLFRPLPKHLDEQALCARIPAQKDVDGVSDASAAGVFLQKPLGFAPCTPAACMRLLEHYRIDCAGKHAVIIGRSAVVGKPLAMLLLQKNATVTLCHSKTEDLPAICRQADILIAACGQKRLVTAAYIKPGAVVLDVGIHWDEETGKLCGDVDFEAAAPIAGAITPVPGGIGAVTTSVLAAHVAEATERTEK